jgi:hypothetical protein
MGKQIKKLEMVLAMQSSVFGTYETTLTGSHFIEPQKPTLSMNPSINIVELVGGGSSNRFPVVGPSEAEVSLSFPLRTTGVADGVGEYGIFLEASGWKKSASTHAYTYAPTDKISEFKDVTLWGYTGGADASGSTLLKVGNLMFTPKFMLDFEKGLATIDFTGKGLFVGAPEVASQPTVSRVSNLCPALRGATITIMGDTDYVPISFELDDANGVTSTISPAATSGKGAALIDGHKIGWKCKVYKDLPATIDPIAGWLASTDAAISIMWGTAPNKFTLATTDSIITDVKSSDQNGIETWDITGIAKFNGVSLVVDTTV